MTNNVLVVNQGTVFGTKTGLMASVVQGEVGKVLVIDIVDQAGTDFPITGATDISASMTTPAGDTTAVTGTISVASGGLSWPLSSGDVGTDGEFSLIVQFTLNGDIYKTHPVRWIIIEDPEATAVQNPSITGVSELEAVWLTAEKAATEAAAAGEILQSDGTNSEGSGYLTATSLRQHNFTATAAPGVGDDTADGYEAGSRWIDVTNDKEYGCLDATLGAAVWEERADTAVHLVIAASDEDSDLAITTPAVTFRMPHAMTLTEVRANVNTAPVGSAVQVDINKVGGSSILSTKITIDAGEDTSETAATPPVISDTALADDVKLSIDIDAVGSSTAGTGLKIALIGTRP